MNCVKCLVSGRVQGVFFRASTRDKANSLGITGYAKNLENGNVEVMACGDTASIEELKSWLWQGPTYAEVSDVRCENVPAPDSLPSQFETG